MRSPSFLKAHFGEYILDSPTKGATLVRVHSGGSMRSTISESRLARWFQDASLDRRCIRSHKNCMSGMGADMGDDDVDNEEHDP